MIERHWRGTARPGRADDYVRHLEGETFPHLRDARAASCAPQVLRRDVPDGTEFRVVTTWRSLDAIRAFAGRRRRRSAVVPQVVAGT